MRCKMANLSLLMENYFMEEDSKNIKKTIPSTKPIVVSKSNWSKNENTLSRIFEFDNEEKYFWFSNEIIPFIQDSPCDIELRLRKNKVTVIIRALTLTITNLEISLTKEIDSLFKDSSFVNQNLQEE